MSASESILFESAVKWRRWSASFVCKTPPVAIDRFWGVFTTPSGREIEVEGYSQGDYAWGLCIQPDEKGEWTFRTVSEPEFDDLHGKEGRFECRVEETENPLERHGPVRVAASGTYFEHVDGTPFFWLADTAWNGPLLSTPEEWETYLDDRAAKGFSVIQFVLAAPWRAAPANLEGAVAFTGREEVEIYPQFYQRMKDRIEAINRRGMVAAPVLLWSCTEEDPGRYLPEKDRLAIIQYEVARFSGFHVHWILAGDGRYEGEWAESWLRIGRKLFGEKCAAPVVMHPGGMHWPNELFRAENWIGFLGYQSGHGDNDESLRFIHSGPPAGNWANEPVKPVVNMEPPYEDHVSYHSKEPHTDRSVRRAVYWSVLTVPTAGVTYGAHGLWSWEKTAAVPLKHEGSGTAKPWFEAISLPGSHQMRILRGILDTLPWWELRPAPELLAEQPGEAQPERFVAAARTVDGKHALFYIPAGGHLSLRNDVKDWRNGVWHNPRNGEQRVLHRLDEGALQTPTGNDWVLALSS